MSERFRWVPDVGRGDWLRPMTAEPLGSILSVVPGGYQAYARVFHPVERDRPRATKTWQGIDEATYFNGATDIAAVLEIGPATWAQAAESFNTAMHAQAQYARLVRRDYGDVNGVISADGWRYMDTSEGRLDADSLTAVCAVLARHTTTPDAGIAAIWDGWGGLVGSSGVAYLEAVDGDGAAARGHGKPDTGSGLLGAEVAGGPRFELHAGTGRSYVLFEAGAQDFADGGWPGLAPWVNSVMWAQSPSMLWPADHSWVLATELDFDSTLVAGTTALIRELVHTPGLEVLPIRTNADLSWDGDAPNRPA